MPQFSCDRVVGGDGGGGGGGGGGERRRCGEKFKTLYTLKKHQREAHPDFVGGVKVEASDGGEREDNTQEESQSSQSAKVQDGSAS